MKTLKRLTLSAVVAMLAAVTPTFACTNLIVTPGASTDGSSLVSYSADSYGMFGHLCHYPAATHTKGSMRSIYDWDTGKLLGEIAEAEQTYNVIGNINEHQVTIAETTFTGREELIDTTGIMDYGSLIYVALQRSRTAREAIQVMTDLVAEYGYYSSGESFTIADPREVWIMEMIGKGPHTKGAVWVAIRIPDGCIAAHANQARIHNFPLNDKENCIYSPDVITFARKQKYFNGKNEEFSFAKAYAPLDFGARRYCEARVWAFYNMFSKEVGEKYLSYITGQSDEPLPLYIRPDRKLSMRNLQLAMRDHYEGTPLDITQDLGAGAWQMPYRPSPLTFKAGGKEYFNERPISTQQTAWVFVSQMRQSMPASVGGVLWFGTDDANLTVFTPIYCCTTTVPECYSDKTADGITFSWKSSFWVFNWVANMTYMRYSQMIDDVRARQNLLEESFLKSQKDIERRATELYGQSPEEACKYLTGYSIACAQQALAEWRKLGEYLIVRYNDMVIKQVNPDGSFKVTPEGQCAPVKRPGYPEEFNKRVADETGERYLIKEKSIN